MIASDSWPWESLRGKVYGRFMVLCTLTSAKTADDGPMNYTRHYYISAKKRQLLCWLNLVIRMNESVPSLEAFDVVPAGGN